MDIKKFKENQVSLSYTSSKDYRKPPKIANPYLQSLGAPHIDSFNYMLTDGLKAAIASLVPVEFESHKGATKYKISIDDAVISKPSVPIDVIGVKDMRVFPTECRQRAATYKGELKIRLTFVQNERSITVDRSLGSVPIMLRSKMCHLADLAPEELMKLNEHSDEWGGYFIIKGHERLARMLLVTRRNFPVNIRRPTWKMRGNLFSEFGVFVRCVANDQTSTNNVLHFLTNGSCKVMFAYRKTLYYAPLILILKCLVDWPDHYIYRLLLNGKKNDLYYVNCLQNMLRELHEENLHTSEECRIYLGRMFRSRIELPSWYNDLEVAQFLLDQCVLIHLDNDEHKFHGLVYMAQKLYDLVQGKCKVEGTDAVMNQELLVAGHLYLQVLKERLNALLVAIKIQITKSLSAGRSTTFDTKEVNNLVKHAGSIEKKMETFLATGNAPSNYVQLPQYKGLCIVAENINRMRYMSHFRAIHRGSFFLEMRTTEARALLPDAWGFVCPVHTPDGAPCGLLNHLTSNAQVTQPADQKIVQNIHQILGRFGMEPILSVGDTPLSLDVYKYPVFLDGRLIGYLSEELVQKATSHLRLLKIKGEEVPITTEIVVIPKKKVCAQYPGVFLMTHEARMMRPVIHLGTGHLELIGTLEQVYLNVAVTQSEIIKGVTTHLELWKSAFMSNLAQLVPMPDCNQSPRNMYQCQMGKQTMGTPIHTWHVNADTKLYRLQTPATPLFRPSHYDNLGLDDFPAGTNAIVAVISYTGYDMEDAMIINKSAYERGFAAGYVYKTEFITLEHPGSYFERDDTNATLAQFLDSDGLPPVGARINADEPYACYFDGESNKYVVCKHKSKEEVFVDSIRQCADFNPNIKKACLVLRIQRNPTVGDKFASRAGQKGICSQKWPAEDLPFTESGLVPDILFNPHGFPSRMTIAMMIECMAGKSASLHGHVYDATPFRFNEKDSAIDYFGRLLEAGGYNYYGTERMYSGVDGREMKADIFYGVIHYQRLRHMVSDKYQVRTTGAVDMLTRQPVKGRKRGGGVRLGEMERDGLISHGASYMLQDRLFHCSDKSQAQVCVGCSSLLGPVLASRGDPCRLCAGTQFATLAVPHVFKLFVTQLASVNINVKVNCKPIENKSLVNINCKPIENTIE